MCRQSSRHPHEWGPEQKKVTTPFLVVIGVNMYEETRRSDAPGNRSYHENRQKNVLRVVSELIILMAYSVRQQLY